MMLSTFLVGIRKQNILFRARLISLTISVFKFMETNILRNYLFWIIMLKKKKPTTSDIIF